MVELGADTFQYPFRKRLASLSLNPDFLRNQDLTIPSDFLNKNHPVLVAPQQHPYPYSRLRIVLILDGVSGSVMDTRIK
jgi:hypothetical protein